jgi:2-dehydro-3-deoxygluconokinase
MCARLLLLLVLHVVSAPVPKTTIYCIGEILALVSSAQEKPIAESQFFTISTGGAEANVASNLASYGFDVRMLSRVGDDPLGARVVASLNEIGVNTASITVDRAANTGLYYKDVSPDAHSMMYYYRKDSAASKMSTADYEAWSLEDNSWIFLSGITAALSETCDQMVEDIIIRAQAKHQKVAFDINYRAVLWSPGRAAVRLRGLAALCDVVFVGLDEAEALWNTDSPEAVAKILHNVRHVVVKNAGIDATEFVRSSTGDLDVYRETALETEVVEPIGAGDAFAAGYLMGLLEDKRPPARLRRGHRLAAWALGSTSDFRPPGREGGANG